MSIPRRLLLAAPVVLVLATLAAGAAAGSVASGALVVLVGVAVGVASNRQIGGWERRGWIVALIAAAWFLAWSQQSDAINVRGAAVAFALLSIACVFARWLQIGYSRKELRS